MFKVLFQPNIEIIKIMSYNFLKKKNLKYMTVSHIFLPNFHYVNAKKEKKQKYRGLFRRLFMSLIVRLLIEINAMKYLFQAACHEPPEQLWFSPKIANMKCA